MQEEHEEQSEETEQTEQAEQAVAGELSLASCRWRAVIASCRCDQ